MGYAKINSVTNANMAKVNNSAKAAIGKIGSIDAPSDSFANTYSVIMDGSNDEIVSDSNVDYDAGTFSLWFKSSTSSSTSLFQKDGLFRCLLFSTKVQLSHPMYSGSIITWGHNFTDGNWHHIVWTVTGSSGSSYEVLLYKDATQIGSKSGTANSYSVSSDQLSIGYADVWGSHWTEGTFDDVAVWSNALSAAEVTAIYNSGAPIDLETNSGDYASSSNLVNYWRMGDGDTHPTITDQVGGNDLTMTNMGAEDIVEDVPS
tara:strand:+ start:1085 stop:1864 length:780 start_codon:yes stop_codon:yes gene_type:complete